MKKWANELTKQCFFKGRIPNGQKTQMLDIPGHKVNSNQNHVDSTSLLEEWLPPPTQTTNVGEDVGRKEPSYTAGGSVN
jgi:hypothetical protein